MNVDRKMTLVPDKALAKRKDLLKGLAALEVVIATGIMIPSLVLMLWLGMKMMAAFFSLFGTMAGSAIS